jgi:hypothetical protein
VKLVDERIALRVVLKGRHVVPAGWFTGTLALPPPL